MTEKELIAKLQELKQITPNKEWVFSTKMSILDSGKVRAVKPGFQWKTSTLLGLLLQRKLAYAFAIFLFVFIGGISFIRYGLPQNTNNNLVAGLTAKAQLQDNVKDFKAKSETLAQIIKSDSPSVSGAIKEVKAAAKTLADTIQKNPELAKTIALDVNNSKTLLDIPGGSQGTDLKEALNTPYKALVEQLIKDEQEVTLTGDQQMVLDNVIELHSKGNDSDALVNLVLLVHSTDIKDNKDAKDGSDSAR